MSIVLIGTGCQAVIVPPVLSEGTERSRVFVVDYGRHASLCLPRADGSMCEYGFGQWDWYALERDEWWRAPVVILWPSSSALSRREWAAEDCGAQPLVEAFAESVLQFDVEAPKAAGLLAQLDARYEAGLARGETATLPNGKSFVRDDEPYWFQRQCNTVLVEWLHELGCRVTTIPWEASYRMYGPTEDAEGRARDPSASHGQTGVD